MARLQVHVFGKLRLSFGASTVESFPTRRVEELLGFLLINRNARHSREKLIDVLWPDVPLSNGRASLSTTLWRLGAVFQKVDLPLQDYVRSGRDWITFETSKPIVIDADEFARHIALADGAADLGTREHALRQAIALYQGVFCDGIYAEWCLLERERLERCYLRALGQLMSLLIERGDYQEAVDRGRAILQLDPLREEVHRALMRCYWRMGRRAEGVRQFMSCARLLQRELQILPMPETIDLYRGMVEDKLGELQRTDLAFNGENLEIQQAFADFLMAAERLSSILDRVQTPTERTAEANPVLRA